MSSDPNGPGWGQPPPGQPAWGPPPAPVRTNGFAVASLVLGILWICWIGSVLAVVFGHVALGQINASQERQTGRGLAIAGLVLGYVGLGFLALSLLFGDFTFDVNAG